MGYGAFYVICPRASSQSVTPLMRTGRGWGKFCGNWVGMGLISTAMSLFSADVFEVGCTDATDAVACSSRKPELNPHRQPLENITQGSVWYSRV